ncbi:PREDICTED: lysocardiolipin acyltransferase 1-like [Nicrophorus vespilloides]|uniref:Lysocardiolipin acyltransferase 1-like n=1 Tax=Nicrophorus vespilloides TaxID=110193 RepID=A0ABM1M3Q1_NICVS|nr:PREDICTED: lysocardiolipin acyltransferase 1-like [Nicrophorus vespilloides]
MIPLRFAAGYIKGIIYIYLWYSSILFGYAGLFCPILPLIFLSNRLYRNATDFLFTFWQMYPTALLDLLFNCKVQVTGDEINADESSLLVMNHRTRTDWNFLWPAVYQATTGKGRFNHPTKFVLKDEIRHIPGVGWIMQLSCFLYIKRNWALDKIKLSCMIDYFCDSKHKFSLLIFPEGTDLTADTKRNSDKYADKHGLQKYDYVLHPRTTGFSFLAERLIRKRALDALYDITIIYCDNVPQNETLILRGQFPKEIKIHFTRYPVASLPDGEEELKLFLEKRWLEKERNIREFYATHQFLHGKRVRRDQRLELYVALVFWTALPYLVVYLLYATSVLRHIVFYHTVFLLLVNAFFGGFQNFEIAIFNSKRKMSRFISSRI